MENKACARRCSTNCLNATISQSQNNSRFTDNSENYNPGKKYVTKKRKQRKIGQEQKTLISALSQFLTAIAKHSFLEEKTVEQAVFQSSFEFLSISRSAQPFITPRTIK